MAEHAWILIGKTNLRKIIIKCKRTLLRFEEATHLFKCKQASFHGSAEASLSCEVFLQSPLCAIESVICLQSLLFKTMVSPSMDSPARAQCLRAVGILWLCSKSSTLPCCCCCLLLPLLSPALVQEEAGPCPCAGHNIS